MAEVKLERCQHFVVRKKRNCHMLVKPGHKFCGEHQPPEQNDKDGPVRVVCPYDGKHTCFAHNLRKHLKICNARPKDPLPHINKGMNGGDTDDISPPKALLLFSTDEVKSTVEKVNKIFNDSLQNIITRKLKTHSIVEEEIQKPEHGDKSKKHLRQASAVLGLLNDYDLIKPETCYIEFGAGRGQISYWLAKATDTFENTSFILVERSSPKHKRDNKLDKAKDKVQRIRADIADLVLDKLDAVGNTKGVVGVTKHLCGEATDLALRCLTNLVEYKSKVNGCVMTFCCHHRCRWGPYTGKRYFAEIGFTKMEFDMMCGMTSWATCGTGFSREKNAKLSPDEKLDQNDRDKEIGLSREEKKEVGRRCKNIINWGRLKFLQEHGFNCSLHYYVEPEISLENVCIVACKS